VRLGFVLALVALGSVSGAASAAALLGGGEAPEVALPSDVLSAVDEEAAPVAGPSDSEQAASTTPPPASHAPEAPASVVAPEPDEVAPDAPAPELSLPDLPSALALSPAAQAAPVEVSSFLPGAPAARSVFVAPPVRASFLDGSDGAAPSTIVPSSPAAPAASTARVEAAATHPFVGSDGGRAAAAVAAGLMVGLVSVGGIALYHRIRPNAALENETRKVIFESVCVEPGLGVHAIAQKAAVSYSTATYHLERLVAAGMIVMTPDGNKLCYYKNGGAFTETERKILPLVKNEEASRLLEAILDAPGTYRAELASRLGVTATTINWHLRRLREAGLVDEIRQGRNAYLSARVQAQRDAFLSLASKVDATDPEVAMRLRRYAGAHASRDHGASA